MCRGSSSRRHWSDNIKLRQIPLDLLHMPPFTGGRSFPTTNFTTSNSSSSNLQQKHKSKGSLVNSSGNIHRKLNLSADQEEEEKKGSDTLSVLEEGRQSHSTESALLSALLSASKSKSNSRDDVGIEDDERGVFMGINADEYIELKASEDIDDDEEGEKEGATGIYDSAGSERYTPGTTCSSNSSCRGYSPLKATYTTSPTILRKKKATYQVS